MQKNPRTNKCIFLQDNKCTIYEVRPLICRFYPFELSTDEGGYYRFRATDECPGVFSPCEKGADPLGADFFRALLELACAEFENTER
jgi:Fe-S-cluster containining protein